MEEQIVELLESMYSQHTDFAPGGKYGGHTQDKEVWDIKSKAFNSALRLAIYKIERGDMWTPKINIKKLDKLPVGIFASGFFLDGRTDSRWVAFKNDDGTWTIRYKHLGFSSSWYAENHGKEWDAWRDEEEEKIMQSGQTLKILSRINDLVECTDKKVINFYRTDI